jgi:hypothetical protein
MSELVNHSEYVEFFNQVLGLDQNIRFVAIHDGQFKAKYRTETVGYFEDEEIKSSLSEAQNRWDYRKKLSFKIGEPKFAMAQYGKINRITIPLGSEGVILVTTELGVDIDKLVDGIIEARFKFFS